jgi:hypothetical protein
VLGDDCPVDEGKMTRGFSKRSRTELAEHIRHTGYNGPPAYVHIPREKGRATTHVRRS